MVPVRFVRSLLLAPAVALAMMALGAAEASAAQRYASPSGSGTACSSGSPCSLQVATESASAGDEVIVGPGTYEEGTNSIEPTALNLDIHGTPGPSKPTVRSGATTAVLLNGLDQRISDLRIEHSGFGHGLFTINNATAQRMSVESSAGASACAGPFFGSLLRDSTCVNTAPAGAGIDASSSVSTTGTIRNVTAIGTGTGGAGIRVLSGSGAIVTLDVRNTIAFGGPLATADVVLNGSSGSANIGLAYSNYDTLVETGSTTFDPPGSVTNQTAAPQLNAIYEQLPTSPTRDAGNADGLTGAFDIVGAQRVQGPAVDIGAFELAPPPPPPPPPAADTTAPETTILQEPRARTRSRRAKFAFAANEAGATFECKLDAKPFKPCTSPQAYRRLENGKHIFQVLAADAAGNADPTPATHRWKVKKKRKP